MTRLKEEALKLSLHHCLECIVKIPMNLGNYFKCGHKVHVYSNLPATDTKIDNKSLKLVCTHNIYYHYRLYDLPLVGLKLCSSLRR